MMAHIIKDIGTNTVYTFTDLLAISHLFGESINTNLSIVFEEYEGKPG